jgi:hypothetical protein
MNAQEAIALLNRRRLDQIKLLSQKFTRHANQPMSVEEELIALELKRMGYGADDIAHILGDRYSGLTYRVKLRKYKQPKTRALFDQHKVIEARRTIGMG